MVNASQKSGGPAWTCSEIVNTQFTMVPPAMEGIPTRAACRSRCVEGLPDEAY